MSAQDSLRHSRQQNELRLVAVVGDSVFFIHQLFRNSFTIMSTAKEKAEEQLFDPTDPRFKDFKLDPNYNKPSCMGLADNWRLCSGIGARLRSYWLHGEIGDCQCEWEDLKNCFWLRSLSIERAQVEDHKLKLSRPTWESQPAVRNNIWAARTEPPPGWSRPGEVTAEKIDPFDASITRDNIPSDATGGPSDPKSFQKQQQHWGGFKNPLD
eukprot:m.114905 g.114905  ORF g.114905 m.114905 type:complete len:211 (+) comp17127_c0_seq3:181-813(+)